MWSPIQIHVGGFSLGTAVSPQHRLKTTKHINWCQQELCQNRTIINVLNVIFELLFFSKIVKNSFLWPPVMAIGRVTMRVVKSNKKGSSLLLSKHFTFIPTHDLYDSCSPSIIDSLVSSTLCDLYCVGTLKIHGKKPNQNKTRCH